PPRLPVVLHDGCVLHFRYGRHHAPAPGRRRDLAQRGRQAAAAAVRRSAVSLRRARPARGVQQPRHGRAVREVGGVMADNVVPLRGGDDSERLAEQAVAEVARRLGRCLELERAAADFVELVRQRKRAGWHKVPMGEFERLAALVEREGRSEERRVGKEGRAGWWPDEGEEKWEMEEGGCRVNRR